ncbi:MAG: GNAT family N-acetyltransferase [Bradyrhizobiaceae bacterium]|nr:MAG: GNAT family N-acetyltransferase [Bradyrhizobiaceae bacterium]
MTQAAIFESRSAQSYAGSGVSRVVHIDVIRHIARAESVWRACETDDYLFTPFQRFDLLGAWQRHVGPHEGCTPFIVVAKDRDGEPLVLLPLGVRRENGANVARFLGGKHPSFNMGLWRRDYAGSVTKADLDALFCVAAANGVDVLALTQQPGQWQGIANPLLICSAQPSPNACPLLRYKRGGKPEDNISTGFRRRLRGKERKLQTLPGYRYRMAVSDEEISRLLDLFFKIKPLRMAAQNLPNVFAEPGVKDFVRAACLAKTGSGNRAITIHALECDEEILAIFAGVDGGDRFSMMFNTYTMSENAKNSPGVVLVRDIIDHYAAANYAAFDLGIGSDDYKRQFCKDDEPIFDSFIALSARGKFAALGMSSLTHAKRMVKQNPALMQMAQRLRGALQH